MSQKVEIPLVEKLKGIPGFFGVRLAEEPDYRLMKRTDHFEIREYPSLVVAETKMETMSESAKNEAFLRLAGYIFGQNHLQQKISMTAPVFEQGSQNISMTSPVLTQKRGAVYSMTFVLPKECTLGNAPVPDDDRVWLSQRAREKWASLRFTGHADMTTMKEKMAELKLWLSRDSRYRILGDGRWAQYDGPWTLPFLRRNEVQIPIEFALQMQ